MHEKLQVNLTRQILIAMSLGITLGIFFNHFPDSKWVSVYLTGGVFDLGGKIFINLLKMLVVPIVFVSLVCGTFSLRSSQNLSRIALKSMLLYAISTALAITLALIIAPFFNLGHGNNFIAKTMTDTFNTPSFKDTIVNIFPSNPFDAFAKGNMLQIIVFSILLGIAITWAGKKGERIQSLFNDFNEVVMLLMIMILRIAPFGVFCLVIALFAKIGFELIHKLASYFAVVLIVLTTHLLLTYSLFLVSLGRLSPVKFLRNIFPAMLFAFSTSSSSASIPVVLNTVEKRCGVSNSIAAFIIPLGATINMDGTAIMQGVATVFIANSYNISLGVTGYIKVILMATLASIGTAGVPSVGLITLTMVLMQVGLPVEGIALIIGVDRLLDMSRTAVNIAGDAVVACIVGRSEKALDLAIFNRHNNEKTT